MTKVQIDLPDALARAAERAGLLVPEEFERMLRERLRARAAGQLAAMDAVLSADPIPPMTEDEIQAEIAAVRAERRRAAGS